MDDDYYVSIPNLLMEIKKHRAHDRIYMGWRIDTTPFRFRFHKHRVIFHLFMVRFICVPMVI